MSTVDGMSSSVAGYDQTKVKSKVQNNSFNPRYLAWFDMAWWSMIPNKKDKGRAFENQLMLLACFFWDHFFRLDILYEMYICLKVPAQVKHFAYVPTFSKRVRLLYCSCFGVQILWLCHWFDRHDRLKAYTWRTNRGLILACALWLTSFVMAVELRFVVQRAKKCHFAMQLREFLMYLRRLLYHFDGCEFSLPAFTKILSTPASSTRIGSGCPCKRPAPQFWMKYDSLLRFGLCCNISHFSLLGHLLCWRTVGRRFDLIFGFRERSRSACNGKMRKNTLWP